MNGRMSLAQHRLPSDLLISGVMMLGMTGAELAIHFRETYPLCKMLLLSDQAATSDQFSEARGSGYDVDLLSKPVHPKDLLAKLED